jgi:S-DNA-T family DNA segregation ATPase FtsK/SpoIIIE
MERRGVVGPFEGSKSRQVLITEADVPRIIAALGEPPDERPDAEPAMSL